MTLQDQWLKEQLEEGWCCSGCQQKLEIGSGKWRFDGSNWEHQCENLQFHNVAIRSTGGPGLAEFVKD